MLEIIPVLEKAVFSRSLHTKSCRLVGADICLSVHVMVAGPVTQAFCREKIQPGTLGVTGTE